ncbi:hypothetical protein ALC60_01300 [Trachymyrmex zeteki]|uniref:Uncharacterized protein n=1 Tax=Mycetomoellerius zeteki TaxID=64791 RepID=A0A151XGV5_9HYME|nr:hypothetical protein ALC60_01300 [Trachymyrmex zeteki]
MSSRLLCRTRLLKRSRKFGLDSSRIHPTVVRVTLPDTRLFCKLILRPVVRTRWRLQAIEISTHPLDYGPRRPPSVVGAVRASVQRSRELLRETGVAWSAREVRSVSFPFTSLSSLSSSLAGTAWEQRYPEFPVLDRNHRVCRAPQRYVVPGRRAAFLLRGCREIFCVCT